MQTVMWSSFVFLCCSWFQISWLDC
jgi:hypothetical protein